MVDDAAHSHRYMSPTVAATAESKDERNDNSDSDSAQWRDSTAFLQDLAQHKPFAPADANPFVVHGKENLAPSRRNIHIYERAGVTTLRAKAPAARASAVRPPRAPVTPSKAVDATANEPFSVLGKRQFESHRRVQTPRKQSPRRLSADTDVVDAADDDSTTTGPVTMVVNDFASVPHLRFGRVAISDRKTLQLSLANPSNLGNARIKYDGYARESHRNSSSHDKLRFKCDLHVCVVPAESAVLLRITFEPQADDLERDVAATLRFTVNDRYKLQCHVSGFGVARAHKKSRFARGHGAFALSGATTPSRPHDGVLEISSQPDASVSMRAAADDNASRQASARRAESLAGLKRRESESLVLDMTPPRRPRVKRHRSELATSDSSAAVVAAGPKQLGTPSKANSSGGFAGSWWSQRKVVYDEHWMVKQEEGFTKWMNYVLLDANSQRFVDDNDDTDEPAVVARTGRRRFDFSSLRVLAQKRIESAWTRSALEIYHAPAMEAIVFDLEDEIARKKLVCRMDRPVYADVGLQEELLALLNNYHPVWLRLGLEAVLGQRVMRDERCSLRSMLALAAKQKPTATGASRPKMPRALRRIVLQHVVHDTHVARKFRLVKNLKTPIDGLSGPSDSRSVFVNTKKRITGREYFDALMESFVRKFLLLVKFLDAAIARRRDAFLHFPCLFRVSTAAPASVKAAAADGNDDAPIKRSQDVVAAFCRLFLASEGRIDKHLRQLGYVLTHEQTALDEVDVEIKNLAVDLRDGVRLAKLMDALTASSSSHAPPLASFLRVPALSRLQKVHNVEICLHFLQETCGHDVLASIKRATTGVTSTARGFARLEHVVDAKVVAQIAKDIVDGHREKTLALLWQLISCFQLQSLVDTTVLQREVDGIQQRMSYRALEFLEAQQRRAPVRSSSDSTSDDVYALLLAWCRAVCANYAVPVSDFTTSFADGRALCYLLHYYHPMLLAKSDILATTADSHGATTDEQLLMNEKRHFALLNERVKQLGEVPVLMPQHYDSRTPPEEKMVVTFVCYLQSRLMDSSREIHAASRLKRWWRSPYVRTQMRIKRNRSARVIQRFWFTSSHKRLAIRQCRRLLRAAHVVKSVLRMWSARVAFTRLRDAATVLQRAWRLHRLQSHRSKQLCERAAIVIQRHWRQYVIVKAERQQRELAAARERIARRLRMKTSGATIANWWRVVLDRRTARALRKRLVARRFAASCVLQRAWRFARARHTARTLRRAVWQYEHESAGVVQRLWRAYRLRQSLARRIVVRASALCITRAIRQFVTKRKRERAAAVARFQQLLQEQEHERRRAALERRVETRAAVLIQCAFRAHREYQTRVVVAAAITIQSAVRMCQQRRRFESQVASVVRLQRTVRTWRWNTHVCALVRFRALLDQYLAQRYAQYTLAAVQIQAAVRGFQQRTAFISLRTAAVVLQRNVRIWRRQRLVQALITFYDMLITYQHMRADALEQLEYDAATRIQATVRGVRQRQLFLFVKRQVELIQRTVRVWRWNRKVRALVRFGHALERERRSRSERLARLQWRVASRAAVTIQRAFRTFVVRRREAAVRIQAVARGWRVRRTRLDFYKMKAQLARLRVFTACWTLEWWFARAMQRRKQQRTASARTIAASWRAHRLRRVVAAKIVERQEAAAREQERLQRERAETAAREEAKRLEQLRIQRKKEAEAKRLEELRIQREKEAAEAQRQEELRIQREQEAAAAEARRLEELRVRREKEAAAAEAKRQEELRVQHEKEAKRQEELRVRREQEKAAAAEAKRQEQLRIQREEEEAAEARRLEALRIQREKEAAAAEARRLEEQRIAREREAAEAKELARLQEAQRQQRAREEAAAEALYQEEQRVRRERASVVNVQSWWRGARVRRRLRSAKPSTSTLVSVARAASPPTSVVASEPPLTLGARLEMALHLLLHGKRLQEMLFASHTIQVCTKYSRECCRRCVKLAIPTTIFAAIRGLNRSRPHVELLHQLLLVLENLTTYQRWDRANALPGTRLDKNAASVLDDARAIEALVDLLHIHRDMPAVFALAASVLQFYVAEMRLHKHAFARCDGALEIWCDAEKRLRGLYDLVEKKAAVFAAVASAAKYLPTPAAGRANPKATLAILSRVLALADARDRVTQSA